MLFLFFQTWILQKNRIFSLPFSLLILLFPLQSPHCCPCPWVLFPFGSAPPPPNLPIAFILLYSYESVSVLLVSSVCLLDSTHEWNHVVYVFLWLAYFTQHNVLQVHPCCRKGWNYYCFWNYLSGRNMRGGRVAWFFPGRSEEKEKHTLVWTPTGASWLLR